MQTKRPAMTGFSTRAVHLGEEKKKFENAVTVPISQAAVFAFDDMAEVAQYTSGKKERFEYGRYGTPTQRIAELKIAALEGAETALLFSTGMNAVTTMLLALLSPGDHMVITDDCYKRTRGFCAVTLPRLNIGSSFVPVDYDAIAAAITGNTKLILTETPTNPHLLVADLPRLADLARERDVKLLVDSTLATPCNLRPMEFGADLVVHSGTKYLGGHNDILAGVVAGGAKLMEPILDARGLFGGTIDPHTAYLLIRGLKTLAIRVDRHNSNGQAVAEFLESHPRVRRVHYPGLASHPDHTIAKRLMTGFGGVVTFELDAGLEETLKFMDAVQLPYRAPSLGGVESLIYHPATFTFYDLSPEERLELGILDELVRYSIGIEDPEDIITDLDQALNAL